MDKYVQAYNIFTYYSHVVTLGLVGHRNYLIFRKRSFKMEIFQQWRIVLDIIKISEMQRLYKNKKMKMEMD